MKEHYFIIIFVIGKWVFNWRLTLFFAKKGDFFQTSSTYIFINGIFLK